MGPHLAIEVFPDRGCGGPLRRRLNLGGGTAAQGGRAIFDAAPACAQAILGSKPCSSEEGGGGGTGSQEVCGMRAPEERGG